MVEAGKTINEALNQQPHEEDEDLHVVYPREGITDIRHRTDNFRALYTDKNGDLYQLSFRKIGVVAQDKGETQ